MRRLKIRLLVGCLAFACGIIAAGAFNFFDHALAALLDDLTDGAPAPDAIWPVPLRQTVESELEEYRVYASLLDARYGDRPAPLVVIKEQTGAYTFGSLDQTLEESAQSVPQLEGETLCDFRTKNEQPHRLKNLFNLRTEKVLLVSRDEIDSYFAEGGGRWPDFYKRYAQADGFWTLSRVGFNRDMTQALVYSGHSCGDTCGNGGLLFLVKEHGAWKVKGSAGVWIS